LLFAVFDFLSARDIVRMVMATCHQWRTIGFEAIIQNFRQLTNEVSHALSYHERGTEVHVRSARKTTVDEGTEGSKSPDEILNVRELDGVLLELSDHIAGV